jgi:hypothetical protein
MPRRLRPIRAWQGSGMAPVLSGHAAVMDAAPLAVQPDFIVADEAVSALHGSVEAPQPAQPSGPRPEVSFGTERHVQSARSALRPVDRAPQRPVRPASAGRRPAGRLAGTPPTTLRRSERRGTTTGASGEGISEMTSVKGGDDRDDRRLFELAERLGIDVGSNADEDTPPVKRGRGRPCLKQPAHTEQVIEEGNEIKAMRDDRDPAITRRHETNVVYETEARAALKEGRELGLQPDSRDDWWAFRWWPQTVLTELGRLRDHDAIRAACRRLYQEICAGRTTGRARDYVALLRSWRQEVGLPIGTVADLHQALERTIERYQAQHDRVSGRAWHPRRRHLASSRLHVPLHCTTTTDSAFGAGGTS